MFLIVTENLINEPQIKMMSLAFVLAVSTYSIYYICGLLYDNGIDIFNLLQITKKKKNNKKKLR